MPVPSPVFKKLPLKPDQYYQGVFNKKYIFLHHTAGGSAASSIAGWAADPDHIATPYMIDRNGDIFEIFDPKYWAYSLGVKGQTSLEKATIAIEITSYGSLAIANKNHVPLPGKSPKYKKGDFITYTDKVIPADKVVKSGPFRPNVNPFAKKPDADYNATCWEAYTPEQIAALQQLLPYLIDKFKIILQTDRKNFWEYQNPATLPPGIYSHTTVRKDKIDIFPQKEIVDLVYSL
jgi:hypothetical protein